MPAEHCVLQKLHHMVPQLLSSASGRCPLVSAGIETCDGERSPA